MKRRVETLIIKSESISVLLFFIFAIVAEMYEFDTTIWGWLPIVICLVFGALVVVSMHIKKKRKLYENN